VALLLAGCADDLELRASRTPAQGMPLVVGQAPQSEGRNFVVWYSGVGGWGPADRGIAARIEAQGLPVVGVDSVRYFSRRKSPQTAAADLSALIERYSAAWSRPGVVLVGYSFGGAALPLILPALTPQARARIRLVVLIAPSPRGELVMRPWTLFDIFQPDAPLVADEAYRLKGIRSLCIADPHDDTADCTALAGAHKVKVGGGHILKGSYDTVADAIVAAAGRP
jgi:type IV secretory pathway VirJ component